MKRLIPVVFLASWLGGCGTIMMSDREVAQQDTDYLIRHYNLAKSMGSFPDTQSRLETELRRREAFSSQEWQLIKAGRVDLGMSKAAVTASIGTPSSRGSHKSKELGSWETWYYDGVALTFEHGKVASIDR